MKRRAWMIPIVGAAFLIGSGLGASARESRSLKEAVKQVVEKTAEIPGEPMGGEDPGAVGVAGTDSTGVGTGLLDEILLSPEPYYYEGLGRRDPFVSLVAEDEAESDDQLSAGSVLVVGILWGDRDKFALVETPDGTSAILREGDSFRNATVTQINKDGIVLYLDNYGIGRTITVPLSEGKGSNNGFGRSER